MKCDAIEQELVASKERRAAVEEHLPACSGCVKAFVEVKRAVELAEAEPLPSARLRQRLRRKVKEELRGGRKDLSVWDGVFAVGLAGAAAVVALVAMHVVTSGPGVAPHRLSQLDVSVER